MKVFNSNQLLEQLQADTRQLLVTVNQLRQADPGMLLQQPGPGKWSVVQVLEHLNSYGRYYIPAIEASLKADKPAQPAFKPGWIGNYFTKLMKPGADGMVSNKMKAPKDHRPAPDLDVIPVFEAFISQQHKLLDLLEEAKSKNIGSIRTPISISKWIKLKVGDTFRFLVAHEQRHFVQISHAVAMLREATGKFPAVHPVA